MTTVLLVLGAYRLTRLLNRDTVTSQLWRRVPSWLSTGWFCPWCLGFWVSLVLVAAVRQESSVVVAVEVLAVSAGVGLVTMAENTIEELFELLQDRRR